MRYQGVELSVRSKLQTDLYKKVRGHKASLGPADKHRIAQEYADGVHTLRALQNTDSSSSSTNTPRSNFIVGSQSPAPQPAGRSSVSSHSSFGGLPSDPRQPRWLDLAEDEFVNDQTIHGVSVSSSRILKLFFQYVQRVQRCVC